ncbi:MAG: cupredoxin domain-containing protein [Acidobacteriota bacterium]
MTKWILCLPFVLACSKSSAPAQAAPSTHVEIAVTEKGFEPADVAVPAGKPVTIVFDRKTDQTCAKQIVVDTGDGKKIEKDLPLNQPVEIATTFAKAGKLGYACAMDMMKGTITVQ